MLAESSNDQFGYNRYLVVAMAPERIERQAAEIRDVVGQEEFYKVIPCHVTVVPPFYGIDSLDQLVKIVVSISAATPSPFITFRDGIFAGHPEFGTAGIELFHQDDLLGFQRRLEEAISPHITGYRYPEEWRYRKHMNYVLGLPDDRLKLAVELGEMAEIGDGYLVESVELRAYSINGEVQEIHVLGEYQLAGASAG